MSSSDVDLWVFDPLMLNIGPINSFHNWKQTFCPRNVLSSKASQQIISLPWFLQKVRECMESRFLEPLLKRKRKLVQEIGSKIAVFDTMHVICVKFSVIILFAIFEGYFAFVTQFFLTLFV